MNGTRVKIDVEPWKRTHEVHLLNSPGSFKNYCFTAKPGHHHVCVLITTSYYSRGISIRYVPCDVVQEGNVCTLSVTSEADQHEIEC